MIKLRFCCSVRLLAVLGTLLVWNGCGRSLDSWWQRVVEVDKDRFTSVQHFTLQGIDYSHHFRFGFTEFSDLEPIINKHGLTADPDPMRFSTQSLPSWFDPPLKSVAFSNGDSDPSIVLWIDAEARIAYFELVKI